MYQLYDKNRDRPGTGAKHVKTASFFIKTGFSFVKNSLQDRLETRVYPPRRPGCGRGTDPGLCEAFTGVWGCLSAVLEVLLCLVFASFSPMAILHVSAPPLLLAPPGSNYPVQFVSANLVVPRLHKYGRTVRPCGEYKSENVFSCR